MNHRLSLLLGIVASLLGLTLTACPDSTKLSSVWVDEAFADHRVTDVLVIAYGARTDEGRIGFEDRFVAEFQERGASAISSHELIGIDVELTREVVLAALAEAGLAPDTVFLGRLIGFEERRTYTPPAGAAPGSARHAALYDVTARDWGDSGVPGYYTSQEVVVIESTLWKIGAEEPDLVWSGETETFDPDNTQSIIDDVAEVIMEAFEDQNFI